MSPVSTSVETRALGGPPRVAALFGDRLLGARLELGSIVV